MEREKLNTVSAENQLETSNVMKFVKKPGSVLKVLFVGNSITRHGPSPECGWTGDWGMAATSLDKDYVHQTVDGIEKIVGSIDYCIAQVADWERDYEHGIDILNSNYKKAREFNADIVIINLGENMNKQGQKINFKPYFEELINFFAIKAEVVVVGVFWENKFKDDIFESVCKENGYSFCAISDIQQDKNNLALNEFEHSGVANHPGDCGMQAISERLLSAIQNFRVIKSFRKM